MMNELLLNCNIGGLFLTMGLPTLDPVMTSVLDYILLSISILAVTVVGDAFGETSRAAGSERGKNTVIWR